MLHKFGAWLTSLGVSREDLKLYWAQVVGVATMIVTGALNLTSLGDYVGIHLSPTWLHRIMVLCGGIVWLAARMSTSPLFNKAATEEIAQQKILAAQGVQQKDKS